MSNDDSQDKPWLKRKKVGYKNPPEKTQFKKGISGNPKGRPKKDNSVIGVLSDTLKETILLKEGNTTREVTIEEASVLALINQASKGDVSAFDEVMKRILSYELIESIPIKSSKKRERFFLFPGICTDKDVWEYMAMEQQAALIAATQKDAELNDGGDKND